MVIWAACIAFVTSLLCLRLLLWRFNRLALDWPNERSLHERAVPRTGGIAVLVGIATSLGFGAAAIWTTLAIAALLASVSFADDLRGMPALVRLASHLGSAALVVWALPNGVPPWMIIPLILGVAWITNVFNFMDGSDGLAGGMTVFGFGAYAIAAWAAGDARLAALSASIVGASLAFLIYNFHPARIFLGDVGSISLGFLAGALGLLGWNSGAWPLWFPVLVFGPFIGDATLTLVRRMGRGERVWRAHRDHYYQRMVRMGFGHRRTAYIAYTAMALCAAASLLGREQSVAVQTVVFGVMSAILATIAIWIDLLWARHCRSSGATA